MDVRWVLLPLLDLRDLRDLEPCSGSSVGSPLTKTFHLGSVKDHLGIIGGVEVSSIEVVLDGISPSRFVATSCWSFPALNHLVEVVVVQGGRMAYGGDVRTSVGGVVVGEMMRLVAWCVHGCFGC